MVSEERAEEVAAELRKELGLKEEKAAQPAVAGASPPPAAPSVTT